MKTRNQNSSSNRATHAPRRLRDPRKIARFNKMRVQSACGEVR